VIDVHALLVQLRTIVSVVLRVALTLFVCVGHCVNIFLPRRKHY
jgi:hypothetical protein